MVIRHFELRNFKSHGDTAVDLYPVTVFVGSNNAGKSALFDALLNFSMVSRGRLSQAFGPGPFSYQAVHRHGASQSARIRYRAVLAADSLGPESLQYTVSYTVHRPIGDPPRYIIHDERLERLDSGVVLFDRSDVDASSIRGVKRHIGEDRSLFAAVRRAQVEGDYKESDPLVTHVAREISRMNKFRLVPENLARPSRLPDTKVDTPDEGRAPRIDYNGEELAGVLYYLAEIDSPVLANLVDRLRTVVVGFDGFEFNAVGSDRIGFSARFADDRGVVAATNLSAGTLSLIGVLTLLLSPSRPPVLLLEEPENGLTPRSTRALYEAVVAVSGEAAKPRTQVLISSHSPFVIIQAWNGQERDFIYQVKVTDGVSVVRPFGQVVADTAMPLRKVKGKRRELGLQLADDVMDGYLS